MATRRVWRSLRWGAASIAITPATATLTEAATQQLTAIVTDSVGKVLVGWDAGVTYTTSDPLIATVDEAGLITAVLAGEATITGTNNAGATDTCVVTVQAP